MEKDIEKDLNELLDSFDTDNAWLIILLTLLFGLKKDEPKKENKITIIFGDDD